MQLTRMFIRSLSGASVAVSRMTAALCGSVVGPVVVGLETHSGRGGDIDDGSAASPLHGLYRSLHDIDVGGQEDLQDAPPVPRLRHWVEGRVIIGASVVNKDVEAGERPLSDGDRPMHPP